MKILIRSFFCLLMCGAMVGAEPGASLTGTVKDPRGQPVPGAVVTLFSRTSGVGSETTSDSAGAYRLEELPAGDYVLRATAEGFAVFAESVQITPNAAETRDVALEIDRVREQVVVTASGAPQLPEEVSKPTTVIGQAEADARDAAALSDVVALAPGLRVQQLGGPGAYTTIQIRGMRTEDTAILVDGLRLRDASAMQADASDLIEDLLFTDANRIEVMRGYGSSLYGTNAMGGVINVITDEGGGRTRGSLLVEGGSLGMFRGRGQWAGGFRKDRIQYSLGVSETDVTSGVNGDSPFRNTSVQGRLTFHLSPSIRLTARLYAADSFGKVLSEPVMLGTPSGLGIIDAIPLSPALVNLFQSGVPLSQINTGNATYSPAPDNPDSTRAARFLSGALLLNGQASPDLDYSVSYQLLSSSRRFGDGPAGVGYQPDSSTRSLYDGRIQTADAQVHYRAGFNLLSGGYEFESENYTDDNSQQYLPAATSATNVTQNSNSVFAQDLAHFFGGRLQLSAAFRAQFFTLDTPAFYPSASAPYQGVSFSAPTPAYTGDASVAYVFPKSETKLRAHAGRGYRAPSLYERFGAGFDPIFGYSVYGDPGLKPEHSTGFDGGIDQTFFKGKLKASATYFYTWLEDVINFDTSLNPVTDPFGRFIGYVNMQGGISRGVETTVTAAPTRSLRITGAYTYVNAIEREPIVGDVIQTFVVPKNQLSVLVTEQVTPRLMLILDTLQSSNYLAPIYGDTVTQTYRFNGIHKVNAGASYRIPLKEYRAIRLFARMNNIFNQTYFESGFPTPGRTGSAGLQFEF